MKSLLALAIAVFAQYALNAQTCSYQYQIPITITNNGHTALTNYQVSFTVNTATPIDAGKMQSTGSDIWFSDAAGDTLYYWIESGLNSSATVFWVNVKNIASTGTTTIYLNYGQTLAASYNDGNKTFLLFDDFTGTTLDATKWTASTGNNSTITVGSGSVTFTGANGANIVSKTGFPASVISEANVLAATGSGGTLYQLNNGSFTNGMGESNSSFHGNITMTMYDPQSGCHNSSYDNGSYFGSNFASNIIGTWSVYRSGNNAGVGWPGATLTTGFEDNISGNQQTALGMVCSGSGSMQVGWVRVRQYYSSGTSESVGTEQVLKIVSGLAMFDLSYASVQSTQNTNTIYGGCGDLIALVNTTNGTASGSTTAKVWIETTQPAQFVRRHYEIEPNTNGSATVTLYFTQADFDAFNAVNTTKLPTGPTDNTGKANLYIEKRGGTSNNNTGMPGTYSGTITTIQPTLGNIVWNASQSRWEITFAVSSFSGFFVKSTSTTLPLTLLNFSGNKQSNGAVSLQWQTANEENLHQFQVQLGTAPGSFTTIGSVTPDNSTGPNTYTYTDNTPWTTGTRYYRLATVENDGLITYSTIVAFGNTNGNSQVTVYPNPARDMVTIVADDPSVLHLTALLCDVTGRVVRKLQLDNQYTQVNIAGLNPGIYILSFANGSSIRILKQ